MDEMEKSDDMLVPLSEGIEKNLAKAAWKLSAGLLNIPLQAIERHLSEKKSDSDARIMVTQTVAQRISEQLDVPEEYVTLAVAKSFGNIVQEQLNLDSVFEKTQQSLQNTPQDETHTDNKFEEIRDDWLNGFRDVACKKSSEEVQDLFSKVLAGEIRKPGSFSLRALTTLSDMDQNVAMIFKAFCSLCLVNLDNPRMYHFSQSKSHFKIKDARIPFLSGGINDISIISEERSLSKFADVSKTIYTMFGLHFSEFQLLTEYGLIEESSHHIEYHHFWYNNELWGFLSPDAYMSSASEDQKFVKLTGYALTNVGAELFHIVEFNTPTGYWERISKFIQDYYNVNLYKFPKSHRIFSSEESAVSGAVSTN